MRDILCLVPCLGILIAGCADSSVEGLPPPVHGYQLKTPALELGAGEEKYLCYTVKLTEPADFAVTKFEPLVSASVHHYEVFNALAPEPEGLWDCTNQQIKQTWVPVYGGGAGASGFTLPQGAGFKIPRDAQLLIQVHLLNAAPTMSSSQVVINMTYADNPSSVTPAGIFALGSMDINLAPGAKGVKVGAHCNLPKQLNVFAVQPHMHKRGTKIAFEHGPSQAAASVVYQRDPWVFGEQPIDSFARQLSSGDYVSTTCTFDNNDTKPVTYGESTKDEMCYFVLFYTPFDRLGGCID